VDKSQQETIDTAIQMVTAYGLDIIGALAILIVGWIVARWVERMVTRALARTGKIDATLRPFFGDLSRWTVLIFTGFAVLSQFGIQTASVLTVFGAGALAIGLALQGTLSNVAAGVMLLIFRPFKIDDFVETAGKAGTVRAINLFMTELATPDNVQILIPNAQVWGQAVTNYSGNRTRRVEIVMGIAYGDDIGAAILSCEAVIAADPRILKDPDSTVTVGELADSSVNLLVRFWCQGGDYWPLLFDTTRALKERFDADGHSIPFPQRDVHLHQKAD
jgi:small conductance mechanosensitive channel